MDKTTPIAVVITALATVGVMAFTDTGKNISLEEMAEVENFESNTRFISEVKKDTSYNYKFEVLGVAEIEATEDIPAHYAIKAITETEQISREQWNECRARKTVEECNDYFSRQIKSSIEAHKAEQARKVEELNAIDYWSDFDPANINPDIINLIEE